MAGLLFIPDSIQKIRIAGVEGSFTEDDILKYLAEAMTSNVRSATTPPRRSPRS